MNTSPSPFSGGSRRGFSLVELLTVLAIISIVSVMAVAAIASMGKAENFNGATVTISMLFEQARAYAMANNTYVFVGIAETDGSQPAAGPQTAGVGRVAIQAFSSLDGTMNLASANLTPIARLQIINNLDLPSSLTANSGTLSGRPSADYVIGSSSFPTVPPASIISSRNFTFSKIIAFDSLGAVHLPTTPPVTGIQYLEIDARPANGNFIPASTPNVSAIQVDATTGMVNIFRS